MPFLDNKYTKIYYQIVTKYQETDCSEDEYTEVHHIQPISLGGNNSSQNLVTVPARVHYILHHLLIYMTTGRDRFYMLLAYNCFLFGKGKTKRDIKVSHRQYEYFKKLFSGYMKEHSALKKYGGNYWMKYKTKEKIQEAHRKKARYGEKNHFYGKKHTSEDLKKAVENRRRNNGGEYTNFTSGQCQYCGLEFKDLIQHQNHCKENPDRKYTIDTETMDWCQYCGKYFVARSGLKIHENKCKRRYARYA